MAEYEHSTEVWDLDKVKSTLPKRSDDSHKGTYGTALLVAGSPDMPGAAILSSLGAMRSGVGKLVLATAPEAIPLVVQHVPEATFERKGLTRIAGGEVDLANYRAIAAGPGLLANELTEKAVFKMLATDIPVVLDAGALSNRYYEKRQAPTILTPHPKEFSRITGVRVNELKGKQDHYARVCAKKLGCTIVLKGKNTIVAFPDGETWQNPTGNSSLAKGGTGDTLTGMLLGMLCIHDDWKHAVLNAVFLHGACADAWIEKRSSHTLLAHELTDLLPEVWKKCE